MTKGRTGNNQFLKKYNETGILDLIRVHKSVSRAELSQLTGLSPTASGVIVASLAEKGYIHETGTGESTGGRRPVMLELKPDSFYSAGVDLDVRSMHLAIIDITGRLVFEGTNAMLKGEDPVSTAEQILRFVRGAADAKKISPEKLLGLGVSVPGMIDGETRKIMLAPNLGWKDVDLRKQLEDLSGARVYVENEAMASAIYEHWIGSCQGVNNFVCINVKSGVGAGIFTDGRLYRGSGGSAGEVGHIVVEENGPRCACGNYGCLEAIASSTSIIGRAGMSSVGMVVESARQGDEKALGILEDSAKYLGRAIANIINTLNPSRISPDMPIW